VLEALLPWYLIVAAALLVALVPREVCFNEEQAVQRALACVVAVALWPLVAAVVALFACYMLGCDGREALRDRAARRDRD
jgi:RsiW-degrading membrane proteinase PrsW (M82 family)